MKIKLALLSSTIALGASSSAFALFDGQVFYGSSNNTVSYKLSDGTTKDKKISGSELGATVLLDPIPLIPIAFGLTAIQGSADHKSIVEAIAQDTMTSGDMTGYSSSAKGSSTSLMYGPTVKVWLPVLKFKPYAKVSYLFGAESTDYSMTIDSPSGASPVVGLDLSSTTAFSHSATEFTAGLSYSPLPLTSVFVEYASHSGKRTAKGLAGSLTTSVDGTSTTTPFTDASLTSEDKKEMDANATSIRFGFSAGI